MDTVSEAEIDQMLASFNCLEDFELQKVLFDEKALQINFYGEGSGCWLTFSLKPGHPYCFLTFQRIRLIKNLKKPLNLFFKTHFIGETFRSAERLKDQGRVIRLNFSGNKSVEVSFIPGRVNVTALFGSRKVSAFKPKATLLKSESKNIKKFERAVRPMTFFEDLWQQKVEQKPKAKKDDSLKILRKKATGLKKMEERLEKMDESLWSEVGEWLKLQTQIEDVPETFKKFVDTSQTLSWNIENCFSQKKKNQLKRQGTLERIQELKSEIEKIKKGEILKEGGQKGQSLLAQAQLKGKTLQLKPGRLYIGRSGPENLKLLRKAKPWYLWLHIKDYPGAHGILEKPKKEGSVDQESLEKAALAVIRQSLPDSATGRFEMIYTECRYVRPIKGAKAGQVTYSHEKVIPVKV